MGAVLVFPCTGEFLLFSYPYVELWRSSLMFRSLVYWYTRTQPFHGRDSKKGKLKLYGEDLVRILFWIEKYIAFVKWMQSNSLCQIETNNNDDNYLGIKREVLLHLTGQGTHILITRLQPTSIHAFTHTQKKTKTNKNKETNKQTEHSKQHA